MHRAYLLGYWLGDGTKSRRREGNDWFAKLSGQDKDLPRVKRALEECGWEYHICWDTKNRNVRLFQITCKALAEDLKRSGLWDGKPLDQLGLSRRDLRVLIIGFFDADGNIQREKRPAQQKQTVHIRLTGIDKEQLEAIQRALTGMGVDSSLYNMGEKRSNRQPCYQVKVKQGSVEDFLRLFPLQPYQIQRLHA